MAATEFDAVVTVDKNMPYQQNLTTLPIAVVILDMVSNKSSYLLPLMPELEHVLAKLQPRSLVWVKSTG